MLQYYQSLITLRKKHPALFTLNRKQLHTDLDKGNKVLILYRWQGEEYILCLMNFSNKVQQCMPVNFAYEWHKVFDSAAKKWNGPSDATESFHGTKPGMQTVELQPESILIYSNHV